MCAQAAKSHVVGRYKDRVDPGLVLLAVLCRLDKDYINVIGPLDASSQLYSKGNIPSGKPPGTCGATTGAAAPFRLFPKQDWMSVM